MTSCYPVFEVTVPSGIQTRMLEKKGSREKYWVDIEGDETPWLLKFPRPDTGEHWAEKVAAEVGNLIGVNCARIELVRCVGVQSASDSVHNRQQEYENRLRENMGTLCRSFVAPEIESLRDMDLRCEFFEGCFVLDTVLEGYDANVRFGQRKHNVKNVVGVLTEVAAVGSLNPMPHWDEMLEQLASYVLLDGLIGNVDRHHENWMISRVRGPGYDQWRVAPSYDHASSLGRELPDQSRQQILASNGVLRYLQRGKGGVFVNERRRRAPPPLRLAQLLCRWAPLFTRRTLACIGEVSKDELRSIIDRVPSEFMTDMAKEFAYEVILTSRAELLRGVR